MGTKVEDLASRAGTREDVNGPAMAAFVAAGLGTFYVGVIVLLNEIGVYAAPAIHPGAGGVSGRMIFATIAWLGTWFVLHQLWRRRDIGPARVYRASIALIAAGVIMTFPPFWALVS
ncbi:MAG TPA: hypothetical protein VNZ57_13185 [Longimicrobiales bacterium]|nr:hypothetical protein [Longimicrobiales bacterium]